MDNYTFTVKNRVFKFEICNKLGVNVIVNAKNDKNKSVKLGDMLRLLNKTTDLKKNDELIAGFFACYVIISIINSNTLLATKEFREAASYYNHCEFKKALFFGVGVGIR